MDDESDAIVAGFMAADQVPPHAGLMNHYDSSSAGCEEEEEEDEDGEEAEGGEQEYLQQQPDQQLLLQQQQQQLATDCGNLLQQPDAPTLPIDEDEDVP